MTQRGLDPEWFPETPRLTPMPSPFTRSQDRLVQSFTLPAAMAKPLMQSFSMPQTMSGQRTRSQTLAQATFPAAYRRAFVDDGLLPIPEEEEDGEEDTEEKEHN